MDEQATPGLDSLIRNLSQLLQAIDGCVGLHLVLPSLILIYAGTDVLGALEQRSGESTQASFTRWAEAYMLAAKPLGCAAIDLYAARCGVLHTFSADSDLYRRGKARRLLYAWGTASTAKLERTADLLGHGGITVHLSDLADAFRGGLARYLTDISTDPARRDAVLTAASDVWLAHMPTTVLDDFLERAQQEGRDENGDRES